MILVFGAIENPNVGFVCSRIADRGRRWMLLDARTFPGAFSIGPEPVGSGGFAIVTSDCTVSLQDVEAVYVHQVDLPDVAGTRHVTDKMDPSYAGIRTIADFLDNVPVRTIDRPSAANSNASKLAQLWSIRQCGFSVPETLVTSDAEAALAFAREWGFDVVYKSASGRRSVVRTFEPDDVRKLTRLSSCPTLFQRRIPGIDVRVHRIGDAVFATEIESDVPDYRHPAPGSSVEYRAIQIPQEVEERCHRLADLLELSVAGIDLRRTPSGDYFGFEVNPAPGFTYYQDATGQRIGDALVDHILRRTRP